MRIDRFLRHLLGIVPTLLVTWTVVFVALQLVPGDPVTLMLGGTPVSDEVVAAERANLGLDRPVVMQYVSFLGQPSPGISAKATAPASR